MQKHLTPFAKAYVDNEVATRLIGRSNGAPGYSEPDARKVQAHPQIAERWLTPAGAIE